MDGKFNISLLISEQEESENTPESGPESPPCSMLNDMKMTSTSSPKRSKRGIHKRVVSVPIKDGDGSRLKGENAPPPSDSWAWRKYGQKPIKGSPYPRGYYRCSSSKGCPARKQVERSKVDPSMLMVTYSCEHNHPRPPPSRSGHHHHRTTAATTSKPGKLENSEPEPEEKLKDLGDKESLISNNTTATTNDHEFPWFGEMEASTILETPIFTDTDVDADVEMFFPMGEEDESLFADLGELPECSSVFKCHRGVGPQVQIC